TTPVDPVAAHDRVRRSLHRHADEVFGEEIVLDHGAGRVLGEVNAGILVEEADAGAAYRHPLKNHVRRIDRDDAPVAAAIDDAAAVDALPADQERLLDHHAAFVPAGGQLDDRAGRR